MRKSSLKNRSGQILGDLLMVICDPRIKLVREKENR